MPIKSPWLALILAIIHGLSGLTILLISAWFIAACAVAGVGFNYALPAVIIRALALIRIASGYSEMWAGHSHLLTLLAKLRLNLFVQLENHLTLSSGTETDKLTFQTEALASIWVGWINQNAAACLAMAMLSLFTLWQLPLFSNLWLSFVLLSFIIYFYLIISSLQLAKNHLIQRESLECAIEQHVHSAPIWHMYNEIKHPDATSYYQSNHQIHNNQRRALLLLLIASLSAVAYTFAVITSSLEFAPLVLIIPMALLAAPDWFGRIFDSQTRLLDYVNSIKPLKDDSALLARKRFPDTIKTLDLNHILVPGAKYHGVSLSLSKGAMVLIQGSSGVGKSRLLQAISGLLPSLGQRIVNGKLTDAILDDCLYTEQQPYCLSASLRDNLTLADPQASDTKLLETLVQLNLTQLNDLDQWVGNKGRILSGGELKRLGLARAMLSKASIILLDEPFEGLDQGNMNRVVEIINELATRKCIVIASHIFPAKLKVASSLNLDNQDTHLLATSTYHSQ
ncbi:ATP-binding cassette domain-containing protein [Thalassotalea piscium]